MSASASTVQASDAESERVKSLRSYQILDTLPDPAFDDIAWMAARLCDVKMAMVSLVDEDRCWFKAKVGAEVAAIPRSESFCEIAIQRQHLLLIPDAASDPRFAKNPMAPDTVRFYAGAPLVMPDEHVIGTLCVLDDKPRELTGQQQELLGALSRQVVALLTYRQLGVRDSLTGLFNRRYLTDALERELHRSDRRNEAVSVLIIDVDHFKHFNDNFGHSAGDMILRHLAEVLNNNTRREDVVARFGGEEFVVMLPGTQLTQAGVCAENLRQVASRMSILYEGRILPQLTVSIGLSSYPSDGRDINTLINTADGALYRAKRAGRNRVFAAHLTAAA